MANHKKVLLDTNILIHRETLNVINEKIGDVFRWLDNLNYKKYIHPVTFDELSKYQDKSALKSLRIKLDSYNILHIKSPLDAKLSTILEGVDTTKNDVNDSYLLNEVYINHVDYLITEDRKILKKANLLGIDEKVFTIDSFLEKVRNENPGLKEYKILSVRKKTFAEINIDDKFFDSFREDYPQFNEWFRKKFDEDVYICENQNNEITAFLYLKIEDEKEPYSNIEPSFKPKKRLKIGTFKVKLYGVELGERFLRIVFENAIINKVDEIYLTIFESGPEQVLLIKLLESFGFIFHGKKNNSYGEESVYLRDMKKKFDPENPTSNYPYFSRNSRIFITPIYPKYHTDLFPDSILRTESRNDFVENKPHRNAIRKVFISRSIYKNLVAGDIIVFYRTGGYYKGVISTLGVVDSVHKDIKNKKQFVKLCLGRSVFTTHKLEEQWDWNNYRPFVVKFSYLYSFTNRLNLKRLIDLDIIADINSVPRGFSEISKKQFDLILKETETDESYIVD